MDSWESTIWTVIAYRRLHLHDPIHFQGGTPLASCPRMPRSSPLGFSFHVFVDIGFERKFRGRRRGTKEPFFFPTALIRKLLAQTLNFFFQSVNLPLFLQTFGTEIDQD